MRRTLAFTIRFLDFGFCPACSRASSSRLGAICLWLLPFAFCLAPVKAFAQSRGAGALLYAGALPNKILVIDEEQEKVVDEISLETGVPRGLRLSYDKKKIYVFTPEKTGIEVVDLATRKVTNHFVLDEGNRRVRTRGAYAPDPEDRLLYAIITVTVQQIDRFEVEKPKFAVIDLAQQKITRTVDLPTDEPRLGWGANLRVSPDGKYLYAFQDNVLIFDTTDFKLAEKIELSKPLYPGMERINLNFRDDPYEERGTVIGVFNSTDPIVRRSIFGIARFDLDQRTFDFTPVGPAATRGMMGLQVTPDRKTGYAVAFQGEVGNRRTEFWVFDMETRKVTNRLEFDGPVNFRFTLSGDGKKIYLHGTAPHLEIYDAATLQKKRVIDINADMSGGLLVLPARAP